MFGEKPIYGQREVSTDEKARMVIPAFTHVKTEDELIFIKTSEGIRVSDISVVDEYIEFLEKSYKEEFDPEKNALIGERLKQMYESILKCDSCDKNRRVVFGNILKKNTTYKVIGCRKSILITEAKQESDTMDKVEVHKPNL